MENVWTAVLNCFSMRQHPTYPTGSASFHRAKKSWDIVLRCLWCPAQKRAGVRNDRAWLEHGEEDVLIWCYCIVLWPVCTWKWFVSYERQSSATGNPLSILRAGRYSCNQWSSRDPSHIHKKLLVVGVTSSDIKLSSSLPRRCSQCKFYKFLLQFSWYLLEV